MPARTPAPRHRSATTSFPRPRIPLRALLLGLVVAAMALGLTVSSGVVSRPRDPGAAMAMSASHVRHLTQAELADREQSVSRSADRLGTTDVAKADVLSDDTGRTVTHTVDLSSADPRTIARLLMPQYGLSTAEFGCLDQLWNKESGWNVYAANPGSGAYGIPQSLPGSKMATAGPNWSTDAETQIRWGLGYIRDSYGSACNAWGHSESYNWY